MSVLKTKGGSGEDFITLAIWSAADVAADSLVTKGMLVLTNSISGNWVSKLPPSVSAVIPVRSEMKKTCRLINYSAS